MSLLKRLFGGGGAEPSAATSSEDYKGFRIIPKPIKEGGTYRISATIEADIEGETKVHTLIRADTIENYDDAVTASTGKAKQVIDEQGAQLFS